MSDLQEIQNRLKDISELLQADTKTSKKKASIKLREICNIASTLAITLELTNVRK